MVNGAVKLYANYDKLGRRPKLELLGRDESLEKLVQRSGLLT